MLTAESPQKEIIEIRKSVFDRTETEEKGNKPMNRLKWGEGQNYQCVYFHIKRTSME